MEGPGPSGVMSGMRHYAKKNMKQIKVGLTDKQWHFIQSEAKRYTTQTGRIVYPSTILRQYVERLRLNDKRKYGDA